MRMNAVGTQRRGFTAGLAALATILGFAGMALLPAAAQAGPPIALDAPNAGSSPLVAYDPGTATTYVAWSNVNNGTPPDTGGIALCVVAANATGCTGGTPVILTDPSRTGDAAPSIAGLVVEPNGSVVVLGSTAQGGVGTLAWASAPGGNGFLTGNNGLENGGNPISPVSLFYTTGNAVSLGNSDVALLDAYGDYFSDSAFAGPESAAIKTSNANPGGPFPRKSLDSAGAEVGAEPTPGVTGSETVVGVGDNYADGSYNPPGCFNYAASGFGVSVGTVNGTSNAAGTLNAAGIPSYSVLDCSAEAPVIASGGTDGMGILEEEGPGVSGQGTDITIDWRPFLATATGGTFGAPVELGDLTSHVLVGAGNLSVVDDSGTGVYAEWKDQQGLVLDYSPNGGANWEPPVVGPAPDSQSPGDPEIIGIGNGVFELAYDHNPGTGTQIYVQTLNYAELLPVTPVTVATNQTYGSPKILLGKVIAPLNGPNITLPAGSIGETDKATIEGADAATATGTVSYALYSKSDCSAASKEFSNSQAVSGGVSSATAGVTKALAPGKYYWQDTYSGDASTLANGGGNAAGVSKCGSEVLTIGPGSTAPSTATSTGTTVTFTVTCASACTETITITVPSASTASVASKKAKKPKKSKPVTIASGKFTSKKGGKHRLTLKLTSQGKILLKKDHGRLKTTLLLSDKTKHGTFKSSQKLKITKISKRK
jgi:hypothetical protein